MAKSTKKLWEINKTISDLQDLLDNSIVTENGVVVDPETGEKFPLDELDKICEEHEEKMKNCLYVYKNYFACVEAGLMAQRDLLYAQIDVINDRIESNERSKKNFGTYLIACTKGEKWKAKDGSFSCWTQDTVSTDIIDAKLIPEKYFKVKSVKTPDRDKIKEAIQNGETILGAKLKPSKSFRVR